MFNIIVFIICIVLIIVDLKVAYTLITKHENYLHTMIYIALELILYIWVILKIIGEY